MSEDREKNIVYVSDDGGHTLELLEYQGSYYPSVLSLDVVKNFTSLEIRQEDVLMSCYPKSGTHWFWELLSQLVAGKAENMKETWKGDLMIELSPAAAIDSAPSPRILNTHVLFEQLPRGIVEKKCKIVHVLRNPKDVAVSYYNHHNSLKYMYKYDGEWKDYLPLFNKGLVDWGSWSANTISYLRAKEQHPAQPIKIVFYEDMIKNPVSQLHQLAEFLGVEADDQLCRDIVNKCSLENMKAVAMETGKGLMQDGVPVAFREGGVGGWKNWFTVAQDEQMDRLLVERMAGYNIDFTYSL